MKPGSCQCRLVFICFPRFLSKETINIQSAFQCHASSTTHETPLGDLSFSAPPDSPVPACCSCGDTNSKASASLRSAQRATAGSPCNSSSTSLKDDQNSIPMKKRYPNERAWSKCRLLNGECLKQSHPGMWCSKTREAP